VGGDETPRRRSLRRLSTLKIFTPVFTDASYINSHGYGFGCGRRNPELHLLPPRFTNEQTDTADRLKDVKR
jgi:hypothetical protein